MKRVWGACLTGLSGKPIPQPLNVPVLDLAALCRGSFCVTLVSVDGEFSSVLPRVILTSPWHLDDPDLSLLLTDHRLWGSPDRLSSSAALEVFPSWAPPSSTRVRLFGPPGAASCNTSLVFPPAVAIEDIVFGGVAPSPLRTSRAASLAVHLESSSKGWQGWGGLAACVPGGCLTARSTGRASG